MLKKSILMFVLMLIWPAVCIADLTGKWSCDDGGTYYLRQIGNSLYWYGERDKTKPVWSNILTGRIKGDQIRGNWADVPKGRTMSSGNLYLAIKGGGNVLVATKKNGNYRFTKLPKGKYRVVPRAGGKFSLISVPRSREVTCTGGEIRNVNFDIKGIGEG